MQIVKTATLLRSQLPSDVLAAPVPLDPDEESLLPRTHSHSLLRGNSASGYVRFAPSNRAASRRAAAADSAAIYGSNAAAAGGPGGSSSGVVGGGKGGTYGTASWSFDAPERTPRGAGIQLPLSRRGGGGATSSTAAQRSQQQQSRQTPEGAGTAPGTLPPGGQWAGDVLTAPSSRGSPLAPSSRGATTASWASDLPLRPLAADGCGMHMPSLLHSARSGTPPSSPPTGTSGAWPLDSSAYAPPPPLSEGHAHPLYRQASRSPRLSSQGSLEPSSRGATTASWASDLPLRPIAADGGIRLPSFPPPRQVTPMASDAAQPLVGGSTPQNLSTPSRSPTPPSPGTPEPVTARSESFHASTALLPSCAAVDSAEAAPDSPRAADVSVNLPGTSVDCPIRRSPQYPNIHRNPSYRSRTQTGSSTELSGAGDDSAISVVAPNEEFLPSLPTLTEAYQHGAGSATLALVPLGSASGRMWPEAETAEFGYPAGGAAEGPSSAPALTGPRLLPLVEPLPKRTSDPRRRPLPIAVLHAAHSSHRPAKSTTPAPRLASPHANGVLTMQPQKTSVSLEQAYAIACGERR
jgi:hypothetical protein